MFETNADEFAAEMREEIEQLEKDTEAMMKDLVDETYTESQRKVPVDTGDLKGSAGKEVLTTGTSPEGRVYYDTPYAAFVGLGTRYMEAQDYLFGPAKQAIKDALKDLAK